MIYKDQDFWFARNGAVRLASLKLTTQDFAQLPGVQPLTQALSQWRRDFFRCHLRSDVWDTHRGHFQNHFDYQSESQSPNFFQNVLSRSVNGYCAIQFASRIAHSPVMLWVMSKQKLDPKHVRDFFFKYALSVRIMTLIFDGIWWVISKSFCWIFFGSFRSIKSLFPMWLSVDEQIRKLHTFIVGRTGAGKSVLLHHLIRHYLIRNRKPSLVILDPHGDLVLSVAKDKANLKEDRLCYIRFDGIEQHFIHLNPFDLPSPSEYKLNRAQLQFSGAMEQIIGEPFTPRQRTLIRACLGVVLHKPDTNLIDLVRLLQDGQNADLVKYGQSQLPNIVDRQFFAASFSDPNYRATKQALVSRLTDIIRDPVVRQFTCRKSSIDLGELLDSGMLIVVQFNPSKEGRETIRTIGQLLNAAILSHVMGRPPQRRHPIHLFIDECQYFVSPTISEILGESRKFGLYVTLATQRIEHLEPSLQDAILGNVGTMWIGSSRSATAEKLSRETDISPIKIRALPSLQFFEVISGRPVQRRNLRYIGSRYSMRTGHWRSLLKKQIELYYRKANPSGQTNSKPGVKQSWKPKFF